MILKDAAISQEELYLVAEIINSHSNVGKPVAELLFQVGILNNNMDAEYQYALLLLTGYPGKQPQKAQGLKLIRSLADRKHGWALYMLAFNAAERGKAVEASQLMTMAADQGNAQAQCQMGIWFDTGVGVAKSPINAIKYLKLAHVQHLTEATFRLGIMYMDGRGVERDEKQGFAYYLEAANKGLAVAQHNVACVYMDGTNGVAKNPQLAIEYYQMAAENGFPVSQLNLAVFYTTGFKDEALGVSDIAPDWVLARKYFDMVSEDDQVLFKNAQDWIGKLDELQKANPDELKRHQKKHAPSKCSLM